ncbi:MAG: hypothetical protein H7837_12745 [Magnetococcus sp. MYC-9]
MEDSAQEHESALLDLDAITVLLVPPVEDPFRDVDEGQALADQETGDGPVDLDEWLAE